MSAATKQSSITVLVSVRIDPVSGRPVRSRGDAAAVALSQAALGDRGEPCLCTAGDMPLGVVRDYLAQGVSELVRLPLGSGDPEEVVAALDSHCRPFTLVLAGPRAESALATGLLPYAMAQRLERPVINEVIDLLPEADGGWRVVQALPRGARRSWRLEPGVAAVLVASPRLASREDLPRRHSWVAAQAGVVVDGKTAAPAYRPSSSPHWTYEPTRRQCRALAPVTVESGAARMAKATGTADAAQRGGTVVREGSVMDKARMLLDHLRKLSLVQPSV